MARPGLKLNYAVIGKFLKSESSAAAVRAAAQKIVDASGDDEAQVVEYETDRAVAGVQVPADNQAKSGSATKAANRVR